MCVSDIPHPEIRITKHKVIQQNWVIRVPNFVKVETKPFHPDTYVGPEEDELLPGDSAREKSNTIKLKVENMLRWRWKKDANGQDVSTCFDNCHGLPIDCLYVYR